MSILSLENVCFGYGDTQTVRNVSLEVNRGDFLAVIGENGAGKSTLLRLMRGLLKPLSGRVLLNGKDIAKQKVSSLAGSIGFLFQNPDRQLCRSSVSEELLFTLRCTGRSAPQAEEMCRELLSEFSLDGDADPFRLSRGERQKVALASALAAKPELLLLDEPTTGLNYAECTQIMDYIKRLNEGGCTVVMICHDMEIVLDYASRAVVAHAGELIGEGDPVSIFYDSSLAEKSAVLAPQIIALSSALGEPFGRITTAAQFADAIENERSAAV